MSLSFELQVGPSRVVRATHALAHLCGAAGAVILGASLYLAEQPWSALAVAIAGPLAALISHDRARSRRTHGRLVVGADGAAQWRETPAAPGRPFESQPFEPLRWHSIGPLAWIDGVSGDRRLRLLSGRDLATDAQWRQLQAWLRWMDRGGASREHLESAASGPISP